MAKYGTHSLEEIGIGTKIVHSYTIDTSKFSRSIDVTAALKAKYEGAKFQAGMSIDAEYHDAPWNDRSAVSIKIFTYGTSDNQLAEITDLSKGLGEHPLAVLRQGWHNPTLIKFYPSSLKPLWKVQGLMTREKAAEFERRFTDRARSAQGSIAMLFEGLQPLYLLSTEAGASKKYRLERTVHYKGDKGDWTLENDGKPWLYTSAEAKPGMAPLRELALNDDPATVRYETDAWIELIQQHASRDGYRWSVTGRVPGYVYENTGTATQVPKNAEAVYAFYDKNLVAASGVFYSHLKELVWDKGHWKAASEASLSDQEVFRLAKARIDAEWKSQSWFYKLFHDKPTVSLALSGYQAGDSSSLLYLSFGIPHWYALSAG
jgi:hypothetical protein